MANNRTFSRAGIPLTQEQAAPYLRVMRRHFPERTVLSMKNRGTWVRKIIQVTLDGDDICYIKLDQDYDDDEWLPTAEGESHERDVANILEQYGLDVVPKVMVVDSSRKLLPNPYIIQAHKGGTRLNVLLEEVPESTALQILKSVGKFYRQLHNITNECVGLWHGSTPDKPWGDPVGYMFQAEVVEGSGAKALSEGYISQEIYDRATAVCLDNLDYLRECQPALVHYSAFPWNIYLEQRESGWYVSKIMSLFDVMWWEPAYDLACLQYPPFEDHNSQYWKAFAEGYGTLPARKRILLFVILQTLCAMMGAYWELESETNREWIPSAAQRLVDTLEEIGTL